MNKEQIYDEQIAQLMTQIIDLCKEHKIAMIASFSIPTEEDPDLICTTALTTDEFTPPDIFREAYTVIQETKRRPLFFIKEIEK